MNKFDDLADSHGWGSRQERDAVVSAEWEARVATFLFQRCGLSGRLREAEASARERGEPGLTLSSFYDMLPDANYPFRFYATSLIGVRIPDAEGNTDAVYAVHTCPRSTEPERFKAFRRVPFVGQFDSLLKEIPDSILHSASIGLVFPRRGFRYGMVIHNDDSERFWRAGSAWVYKGVTSNPVKWYVQPMVHLVDSINEWGWKDVEESKGEKGAD